MTGLIATFGGVGYLRPAPGTWGSLAALLLALPVLMVAGPWGLVVATVLVGVLGLWAAGVEIAGAADPDPGHIVIDEVVGQWIALWPIAFGAASAGASVITLWPGWLAAFVLFRLFDIWKPGPVGWADRQGGAAGLMGDDVIAGVMAAIGVTLLAGLYHAVLAG